LKGCYLSKILSYFGDQIKDEKLGGENNSQMGTRNSNKSFLGNVKKIGVTRDLDVYGRISIEIIY